MVTPSSKTNSDNNNNNNNSPSFSSCSSSSCCWLSTVQRLNNHGCVLLMKGNFAEANCVFQYAITNHEQHITSATDSSSTSTSASSSFRRCHCHNYEDIVTVSDAIIEDTTTYCEKEIQSTTASTTTSFYHESYDEEDHHQIHSDYNENCTATAAHVTNQYEMSADSLQEEEASSSSLPLLVAGGNNAATTGLPLRRMTTDSQLRMSSYCGRQSQYHHKDRLQFQQVYSLPIVMDKEEWNVSTVEDKSFVLIYNTALCNHLWGMNLLVTIRDYNQEQEDRNNNGNSNISNNNNININININFLSTTCERRFHLAKNLYRLTLENVLSSANVDQLCYVAIFNNMSHVLKTLEGYNSQEVYHYDMLLLKAINWWKETNPSLRNNNNSGSFLNLPSLTNIVTVAQQQQQQDERRNNASNSSSSISSHSNNDTNSYTNTNTNTDMNLSSYYHDDDLEIIDSFLENVFYLVGVPNVVLPAPAA